ncbi:MAG TPA: hypothetical protein VII66_08565 [Gemmatimonadaceae bacterium]
MMLSNGRTALLEAALVICATACASSGNTQVTDTRTRMAGATQSPVVDMDLRQTETTTDQNVTVTAVQAFDALPAAYTKLGINDAAVVDTTRGVYTVGARNLHLHGTLGGTSLSNYIDCGDAPMYTPANTYDVNFSATTYITPRNGGATLHTMVTASGRDPAANMPSVSCTSTGAFERQLAALVSAQ